ncbi:hypothetical protein OESDEN_14437 [Oesophagostomum dentatum]|uniref:Uncharacterized protein n=1 Tax=Oesophagostomum dentatum TaxID=61180 RepID=A0A0B1SQM3_OESDE|nr:hypothetical protein OESDEN_14437 [Oesophagostomum dentatum]
MKHVFVRFGFAGNFWMSGPEEWYSVALPAVYFEEGDRARLDRKKTASVELRSSTSSHPKKTPRTAPPRPAVAKSTTLLPSTATPKTASLVHQAKRTAMRPSIHFWKNDAVCTPQTIWMTLRNDVYPNGAIE